MSSYIYIGLVYMYLMFDKVWNGECNEYAVDSRIIGVKPLYSFKYTCWKVLEEKALLSIVLSIPI